MISVLFMSVDGAADIVNDGHPHGDATSHQVTDLEANGQTQAPDSEGDSDHCERCCHGHSSGIAPQVASIVAPVTASDRRVNSAHQVRNLSQAPLTPPPNA